MLCELWWQTKRADIFHVFELIFVWRVARAHACVGCMRAFNACAWPLNTNTDTTDTSYTKTAYRTCTRIRYACRHPLPPHMYRASKRTRGRGPDDGGAWEFIEFVCVCDVLERGMGGVSGLGRGCVFCLCMAKLYFMHGANGLNENWNKRQCEQRA